MSVYKMPYGQWRGQPIENVPTPYLEWLLKASKEAHDNIQKELDSRAAQEAASQSMARRVIEAGYRQLSKQMHPDLGGDTATMQELNGTVEQLRRLVS